MPLRVHRIPPLALVCLAALASLILFYLLFIPGQQASTRQMQDDYGNALASATAKRVLDATFNNDLVRMQTALEDVISHPHLAQATIHDVENTLLVQAGELRPNVSIHSPYTASIVLHDSISGYVTITLNNFEHANNTTFFWTVALLLVVLAGGSLYHAGTIEWIPEKTGESDTQREHAIAVEHEDSDELDQPTTIESSDNGESVFAVVHISNFDVLKQQLNGETFRNTLNRFESIVKDVMALYNGRDVQANDNCYTLSFIANDATNEAIFRASCSAFLIVELASIISKVPLDLAAFVSANNEDLRPAKMSVAGLVLETQAAKDELIQRRLNFMEVGTEDGRMIVADFEQPFASLLEKQRKQLSALQG